MAGKNKSMSELGDSSERTYQHSNFMDYGVTKKGEGARREERMPEDSVNEQHKGETVDVDLPKGTDI